MTSEWRIVGIIHCRVNICYQIYTYKLYSTTYQTTKLENSTVCLLIVLYAINLCCGYYL